MEYLFQTLRGPECFSEDTSCVGLLWKSWIQRTCLNFIQTFGVLPVHISKGEFSTWRHQIADGVLDPWYILGRDTNEKTRVVLDVKLHWSFNMALVFYAAKESNSNVYCRPECLGLQTEKPFWGRFRSWKRQLWSRGWPQMEINC